MGYDELLIAACSRMRLASAMFNLHVHIDGPYVHSLGIVTHDALKHSTTVLGRSILELQHAKLGNNVHMI